MHVEFRTRLFSEKADRSRFKFPSWSRLRQLLGWTQKTRRFVSTNAWFCCQRARERERRSSRHVVAAKWLVSMYNGNNRPFERKLLGEIEEEEVPAKYYSFSDNELPKYSRYRSMSWCISASKDIAIWWPIQDRICLDRFWRGSLGRVVDRERRDTISNKAIG